MARLRYTDVIGTIGSGNLTSSATSHTFTAPLTYGGNATAVPTLAGSDYFMLSILTTAGLVREVIKVTAYNSTTGAATIVRGQEGTTGTAATSGDKVTLDAYPSDMGGVGTGILAYVKYAPASLVTYTASSGTEADVDATNLVVTFVAPPSGAVLVSLIGYQTLGSAGTISAWCLRDGSTTVANSIRHMSSLTEQLLQNYAAPFTGLTPGTSYTWKWAYFKVQGSSAAIYAHTGKYEPTMVIQALP